MSLRRTTSRQSDSECRTQLRCAAKNEIRDERLETRVCRPLVMGLTSPLNRTLRHCELSNTIVACDRSALHRRSRFHCARGRQRQTWSNVPLFDRRLTNGTIFQRGFHHIIPRLSAERARVARTLIKRRSRVGITSSSSATRCQVTTCWSIAAAES